MTRIITFKSDLSSDRGRRPRGPGLRLGCLFTSLSLKLGDKPPMAALSVPAVAPGRPSDGPARVTSKSRFGVLPRRAALHGVRLRVTSSHGLTVTITVPVTVSEPETDAASPRPGLRLSTVVRLTMRLKPHLKRNFSLAGSA